MEQSQKILRLSKVAKEFNVGISTIVDFLHKKGYNIDSNPNTKITDEVYSLLVKEYSNDLTAKKESEKLNLKKLREKPESISINDLTKEETVETFDEEEELLIKDLSSHKVEVIKKTPEHEIEKESEKVIKREEKEQEKIHKEKHIQQEMEGTYAPVKETEEEIIQTSKLPEPEVKIVGKIDLSQINQLTRPPKKSKEEKKLEREKKKEQRKEIIEKQVTENEIIKEEIVEQPTNEDIKEPEIEEEVIKPKVEKLTGPTIIGKIELTEKPETKKDADYYGELDERKKKKRKRIKIDAAPVFIKEDKTKKSPEEFSKFKKDKKKKKKSFRPVIDEEDVQKQIKETLARLTSKGKSKGAKYRKEKREAISQREREIEEQKLKEQNILKIAEFVTVKELATMMNVPSTKVIETCMNLGLFVSINQRLDAETISIVADEYNYKVEFVTIDAINTIKEEEEDTEDKLKPRPPIVTVMGHVDHGKTKLLDYIRNTNVVAGEAGGITQHIGAYSVELKNGQKITFLDTPGHEAFTAMRARGAKLTDVSIIVVAADDGIMPQTIEAINHAQAAGVPIVFAINKIDKPTANPEKIKEQLAKMNLLVEDWGGKYQSQEISAKTGLNIDLLLDKVLLEAELLDLKANPDKPASGTVIESSLDKGRGYVATVLVQSGTLKIGDIVLSGIYYGKVKALFNERGKALTEAGPSTPVLILGLNGAPQAGETFNVLKSEKEAKEIAVKREQLQREQGLRTHKHITLDEIGRRIAIGNFKELNIIVKGDVDGSVEALSDSLLKLSTEQVQVNVIHKAVGQISDSDIMLAMASNAIVIGFQVRPAMSARKLAEKEQIDIRLYSIIYDAINEIKDAIKGMLAPTIKEEITGSAQVKEVFKISKVGTVAGCIVKEGKITRSSKVRVIRDGIVIYTGDLGSLKRFKEDVKEVTSGLECGLNIENFNDVKVDDIIEAFVTTEVKA
jgi:translation initiation factor IF-2